MDPLMRRIVDVDEDEFRVREAIYEHELNGGCQFPGRVREGVGEWQDGERSVGIDRRSFAVTGEDDEGRVWRKREVA